MSYGSFFLVVLVACVPKTYPKRIALEKDNTSEDLESCPFLFVLKRSPRALKKGLMKS